MKHHRHMPATEYHGDRPCLPTEIYPDLYRLATTPRPSPAGKNPLMKIVRSFFERLRVYAV